MAKNKFEIIIQARDLASKGFKKLNRDIAGFSKQASRHLDGLKQRVFSLQGALVGLGAGMVAKGFIDTASSFEMMEIKLDTLTKGKGVETLEAINAWARKMPVDTEKAIDAFAMMMAMGLNPTLDKMETLVDVSSIFGEDALTTVARALGQIQTLGKLSAEELNQLSEAGIDARKYLKEAFGGKSVEEIQKAGIAVEKILDAIWKGLVIGAGMGKLLDEVRKSLPVTPLDHMEKKLEGLNNQISETVKALEPLNTEGFIGFFQKKSVENLTKRLKELRAERTLLVQTIEREKMGPLVPLGQKESKQLKDDLALLGVGLNIFTEKIKDTNTAAKDGTGPTRSTCGVLNGLTPGSRWRRRTKKLKG